MNSQIYEPVMKQPLQSSPSILGPQSVSQTHLYVQQAVAFGPSPILMNCPSCNARIRTAVSNSAKCTTHLWCLCLMCCGCPFGCCLFPYCMDSCQAQKHTCPNCKNIIGVCNN